MLRLNQPGSFRSPKIYGQISLLHGLIQTHRTSQFHHPFISVWYLQATMVRRGRGTWKHLAARFRRLSPLLGSAFGGISRVEKLTGHVLNWRSLTEFSIMKNPHETPGIRWTRARFERPNHRNQGFRGRGSSLNWNRLEGSKSTPKLGRI